MNKIPKDEQGFSAVEVLLVLVIVVLIGVAGWFVYKNYHKTTAASVTTTIKSTPVKPVTPTQPVNPYAGWKTYCDSVYGYCFEYPPTWQLPSGVNTATQDCDVGGTQVTSPDGTVVEYENDNNHDGGLFPFTAYTIQPLTLTSQKLTVIGGYSGWAGIYPSYDLVDSSTLTQYPLTVGQTNQQFPQPIEFTDNNTGTMTCTGSFSVSPAPNLTFNSAASAQSWLKTSDALMGQLILESFYPK